MSEAAKFGKKSQMNCERSVAVFNCRPGHGSERANALRCGFKDPQQRQHWLDGDGVELNRIIGFEAYTSVLKQNRPASTCDSTPGIFCGLSELKR